MKLIWNPKIDCLGKAFTGVYILGRLGVPVAQLCMLFMYAENCKHITFGNDVFFLALLAVESLRQFKYTAKCAFIKV